MDISLEQARHIIAMALAAGRAEQMMPLTVAVLDRGGHLVALEREDDSGILRVEIATGKAYAALGMGVATRTLRDRLADRPNFVSGLSTAAAGRFVPVPGGVLVRTAPADGPRAAILGAVGVSGDTSDRDEHCAIAGINAAGLSPDPSEPDPNWRSSRL